jgi:hypothetical protein
MQNHVKQVYVVYCDIKNFDFTIWVNRFHVYRLFTEKLEPTVKAGYKALSRKKGEREKGLKGKKKKGRKLAFIHILK